LEGLIESLQKVLC